MLGTSPPGQQSICPQDRALEEMLGSKSAQTLPPKGQSPPKIPFRNKMKGCFQCLNPGSIRCMKKQENSHQKGIPISSTQSRGSDQSRAVFTATTKGHKVQTRIGKFLQEKLGRRRITVIPFPEEPLPFPVKSGNAQQKSQIRAQAGPIQGQLLCQTHPNQGPQGAWAPSKPHLQGSRSTGPSGCSYPF